MSRLWEKIMSLYKLEQLQEGTKKSFPKTSYRGLLKKIP
jgi:hypothetical protein